MSAEFMTFDRFQDRNSALALVELLKQNGIENELEDDSAGFDPTFNVGGGEKEFCVKLRQEDFAKADVVVENAVLGSLDEIGDEYYLFHFTNEELTDVIVKRDEWSVFDYMLAQKLLRERGHEIFPETLKMLRAERIAELSKPQKPQTGTVVIGYLFALMGGALGIVIGWYLSSHKHTLPNGKSVFTYNESDRKNGRIIFYLGFTIVAACIGYSLLSKKG